MFHQPIKNSNDVFFLYKKRHSKMVNLGLKARVVQKKNKFLNIPILQYNIPYSYFLPI